jgi:hypothetical protein
MTVVAEEMTITEMVQELLVEETTMVTETEPMQTVAEEITTIEIVGTTTEVAGIIIMAIEEEETMTDMTAEAMMIEDIDMIIITEDLMVDMVAQVGDIITCHVAIV